MPTLLLTIGASSSGKTTWVNQEANRFFKNCAWMDFNRDDVRFELFNNGVRDWTKYKFNNANENRVTNEIDKRIEIAIELQLDICISDTNLNPAIRNKWKVFADKHGYAYEEMLFPCDWNTLVKRNAQRQGGLSESLLWSQYKRFMEQFGYYGDHKVIPYAHNPTLDYTVWVDIDGCVADMTGIRKPFEWDKVHLDSPRHAIIDMVQGLAQSAGHVTFMSGRDAVCYDSTYQWLMDNVIDSDMQRLGIPFELHMRAEGDPRKDDIVKYEMYLNHIKDKRNVYAVIDDRYSVIRMQSVVGFPNIIQVGDYQNEF